MGESVAGNNAATAVDEAEDAGDASTKKSVFSTFADLGVDPSDVGMENEEDFGGLMVSSFIFLFSQIIDLCSQAAIQASSTKGKKDKKKTKTKGTHTDAGEGPSVSFADGPRPGEGSDTEGAAAKGDISAPAKPVTVTADDLADEEWGPVKEKGGKKKKGKKGKVDEEKENKQGTYNH